VLFMR